MVMGQFWNWLTDNYGPVSAITGIFTLIVWAIYLQLIWSGYRHRNRARILISWGGGGSLDSRCIVTNMSVEPVYLQAVLLEARDKDINWQRSLSHGNIRDIDTSDVRKQVLQGPLDSGEMIDIGTFREMLARAGEDVADVASDYHIRFKVTIVATYTAESTIVAVERDFEFKKGRLSSPTLTAKQIRSRGRRRRLEEKLSKANQ